LESNHAKQGNTNFVKNPSKVSLYPMPITRSSSQPDQTLKEYYTGMAASGREERWGEYGVRMLEFIEMINKTFTATKLYGLTSHHRLVLQSGRTYKDDWYIIVSVLSNEYYFEYKMSQNIKPWENAYVRGEAKGLEKAKIYLIIAMKECEGWPESEELQKLYESIDV
jgi:hypothetical protein